LKAFEIFVHSNNISSSSLSSNNSSNSYIYFYKASASSSFMDSFNIISSIEAELTVSGYIGSLPTFSSLLLLTEFVSEAVSEAVSCSIGWI